jgi:hypothetical protein
VTAAPVKLLELLVTEFVVAIPWVLLEEDGSAELDVEYEIPLLVEDGGEEDSELLVKNCVVELCAPEVRELSEDKREEPAVLVEDNVAELGAPEDRVFVEDDREEINVFVD